MKIIEEAKRRKIELENELKLIDQLLSLYSESWEVKEIPEDISQWHGISVRTSNCLNNARIKKLSQLLMLSES